MDRKTRSCRGGETAGVFENGASQKMRLDELQTIKVDRFCIMQIFVEACEVLHWL
jgi:hypothetical protein